MGKEFNNQPVELPYDEWSRRQIVTSFIGRFKGDLTLEDLPKIENYCINGVFAPTEKVERFEKFIKVYDDNVRHFIHPNIYDKLLEEFKCYLKIKDYINEGYLVYQR